VKARTLSPLVVLFLVLAGGRLTLSQSPPATAKPAFPPNDPVTRAMTEAGKLLFSWGTFGQFPGGF
jgi:hypothetical protein